MAAVNKKKLYVELITAVLVMLFMYTGLTKLLYNDDFKFQLGRSPYLQQLTKFIAITIPVAELVIVAALLIHRTRLLGLYASFGLMALFTGYTWIMLQVSYDLPCSCGGILEALSWKDHLVFNSVVTALTLGAIFLHTTPHSSKTRKIGITCSSLVLVAIVLFTLVQLADAPNKTSNGFTARLLPSAITQSDTLTIDEPNKQFCGATATRLYFMGKNPREVFTTDFSLRNKDTFSIHFPLHEQVVSAYTANIDSPVIKLFANNSAAVFSASLTNSKEKTALVKLKTGIFTSVAAVSAATVIVRALDTRLQNQVFMKVNMLTGELQQQATPSAWENKGDLGFSDDGMLQYDSATHTLIYLHYYSNRFVCIDTNLNIIYTAKTIDTSSANTVAVKRFKNAHGSISQLPAVPVKLVNRYMCAGNGWLFVLSNVKADNETTGQFQKNTRIDRYEISTGNYSSSFYIPAINGEKAFSIHYTHNRLIALYNRYIGAYRLSD